MAIVEQGITGAFIGKVGTVIGYQLNGQNVMRSIGRRRTKPFSELELLNQAKMKVTSEFLRPIKSFIKFGFREVAPEGSRVGAFQLAQSHVRKQALDFDAEGKPFVNPAKVLISKGSLEPPRNCRITQDGNRLIFNWDPANGAEYHRLLTLAYDGDSFRFFRNLGAERGSGEDVWDLSHLDLLERPLHVYAAFRSTVSDKISDSVYCGTIQPGAVKPEIIKKTSVAPSEPGTDRSHPQTPPAPPSPPSGQFELAFPDR